ncbi:MAG: glycerate kinase [Proteobacteria bacterium]|nr:glycerate kinase [Pseudomonadota bacterium]
MKVVLAPNAFKDSVSAIRASQAMEKGVRAVLADAEIQRVPIADGGDGLTEIAFYAMGGEKKFHYVHNPVGKLIEATYCYFPEKRLAIIEMAEASGLRLLSACERNPMLTSTYGTGELIAAALDLGASRILVGLGGSATCDGGIGMAAALGMRFLDDQDQLLEPLGGNLQQIARIDAAGLDRRIPDVGFEAICDVSNPLLGENGAAAIYGPQKGAAPEEVEKLEQGLTNLARLVGKTFGHQVQDDDFGGAAGGLGMGLAAFLGTTLRPGIDVVLDLVEMDKSLENADLVFTGEGRLDGQTAFGKAPAGVAALAKTHDIPCFAIAGSCAENLSPLLEIGFSAVFSLCPGPIGLEEAISRSEDLLRTATEHAFRAFLAGRRS